MACWMRNLRKSRVANCLGIRLGLGTSVALAWILENPSLPKGRVGFFVVYTPCDWAIGLDKGSTVFDQARCIVYRCLSYG